jgi:hypothetical protein
MRASTLGPLFWALVVACCLWATVQAEEPLAGEAAGSDAEDLDTEAELEEGGIADLRGAERQKAIQAIFANPKPDRIRDLNHILKADLDSRETEERAFSVLMGFRSEKLLPVGKALSKHAILYKQIMGIRLLGASGSKKATPVLLGLAQGLPLGGAPSPLQYDLICALADLGAPQALPWLREAAKHDAYARVAVCSLGDFSPLPLVLRDHDRFQAELKQLLHDMDVLAPYWTPAQKREAAVQADRLRDYVQRFRTLFPRFGKEQMAAVTSHLQQSPGSSLPDVLYVELARLVNAGNGTTFVPLLDVPIPELQEETAWVLADLRDAAVLERLQTALRAKAQSRDMLDRAVAVRLVGLFPEGERAGVLRVGLRDGTAYVVVEALKALLRSPVTGLAQDLAELASGPRWRSDTRIQRLAQEAAWQQAGTGGR